MHKIVIYFFLNNEKYIIKQLFSVIVLLLCLFPIYSYSESLNDFKFPKRILYKCMINKTISGSSSFCYEKNIKRYILSLKNFRGFSIFSNDVFYSLINTNYQFQSSTLVRGKDLIAEIRLLNLNLSEDRLNHSFSFLGGDLIAIKNKHQRRIIETFMIVSDYMDLLSSFVLLSKKMHSDFKYVKKSYVFIILSNLYMVNCKYIGQENYYYRGSRVKVTKYLIDKKSELKFSQLINHSSSEFFNFAEYYIYKDDEGYCFPVAIKLSGEHEYFFRAAKILK